MRALLILLVAAFLTPTGSASDVRTVEDRWVSGFTNDCVLRDADDLLLGAGQEVVPALAADARSCFALQPGETQVTLRFADDRHDGPVAYWHSFSTPGGNEGATGCGTEAALAIPEGATVLSVVVYPFSAQCGFPATSGILVAMFA